MQIVTDTLRSIYTSDTRKKELWDNIFRFHYDTALLKKMAAKDETAQMSLDRKIQLLHE